MKVCLIPKVEGIVKVETSSSFNPAEADVVASRRRKE